VIAPVLIGGVGAVFAVRLDTISRGLSGYRCRPSSCRRALVIAMLSYCTAVAARLRIRRDLRRIALPKV